MVYNSDRTVQCSCLMLYEPHMWKKKTFIALQFLYLSANLFLHSNLSPASAVIIILAVIIFLYLILKNAQPISNETSALRFIDIPVASLIYHRGVNEEKSLVKMTVFHHDQHTAYLCIFNDLTRNNNVTINPTRCRCHHTSEL